ncbi:response regulator [Segetibacter koreensis]|uniref:response regulator n=1 Tax=Segetibacter koreensis TaxID=398037 RepID=UPI00035F6880|nr:response regulator [Segetibacter koreensis]
MKSFFEMLQDKQFIVVDDDEPTLFYSSAVIKKFFYFNQFTGFKDPRKAVEYFENTFRKDPSETLVLLDISMHELSGWDVLDKLQLLPKDLQEKLSIIMVSSSIDPADKIKANDYTLVIGYIEKPLSIKKLKDLMDVRQRTMNVVNIGEWKE